MGIFERFGIMRSILTVECVGWFGTKEYLSVIFRNIGWLIQNRVNHLKTRAHYSIHHNLATDEVFAADKKTPPPPPTGISQHRVVHLRWWPAGDHRWAPGTQVLRYSGTQVSLRCPASQQIRRWCLGSVAAWSSGAGCAKLTAGRPSQKCAPVIIISQYLQVVGKYTWKMQRNTMGWLIEVQLIYCMKGLILPPLLILRWCSSLRSFWRRRSWGCGGSQTGCQSSPEKKSNDT